MCSHVFLGGIINSIRLMRIPNRGRRRCKRCVKDGQELNFFEKWSKTVL